MNDHPVAADHRDLPAGEATGGVEGCLACDLTEGRAPLPGGIILESAGWLVEHCIGPLGTGTLILKPRRHVTRFSDLSPEEAAAFGPLLHCVTRAIGEELGPDQTYICQWAHAGWTPGHIHFVIQPAWDAQREQHARPGPFMQAEMFEANEPLDAAAVEAFCERMRERLTTLPAHPEGLEGERSTTVSARAGDE